MNIIELKINLVMLGVFGVRIDEENPVTPHYTKSTLFTQAWQKIIRRLIWVFGSGEVGTTVAKTVLVEYNKFKGLGEGLDENYFEDKNCKAEAHTSQAYDVQFDMITDGPAEPSE